MNRLGRDVRRSIRFASDAAQIDADIQRMDDALRFVEEVLSVTPTFGLRTRTCGIWIAPVIFWRPTTSGFEGASIFYAFDDQVVDLLSVIGEW